MAPSPRPEKAHPVVPVPMLRVTAGELTGTVYRLDAKTGTLGRRPANTYVAADPTVSRLHARLSRRAGAVIVTDLDSTGGTHLNGGRLDAPAVLHHGDELHFGSLSAVFEDPREFVRDEHSTQGFEAPQAPVDTALPPRHQQVLELISEGLSNREIGTELGITEHTVKDYAGEIYRTLGVRNRAGAVGRAVACGLVDGRDPEVV